MKQKRYWLVGGIVGFIIILGIEYWAFTQKSFCVSKSGDICYLIERSSTNYTFAIIGLIIVFILGAFIGQIYGKAKK